MARLPDYLIAGVMKSGTTAMALHLGMHPQVSPTQKEINFFNNETNWARGLDWYGGFFKGAGDGQLCYDATPNYLSYEPAAQRIADTLPDVKVIAILRNPVDRAYSHFLHWRDREVKETRTFEQAIADELESDPAGPWRPDDVDAPYFGYLARGHYVVQLQRMERAVGSSRLHVILNEDLEQAPLETYRATCRFLGIDDSFVPERLGERVNEYLSIRPRWLFDFILDHQVARRLPAPLSQRLMRRIMKPGGADPIDPAMRDELTRHFEESNRALGEYLRRDLGAWLPAASVAARR